MTDSNRRQSRTDLSDIAANEVEDPNLREARLVQSLLVDQMPSASDSSDHIRLKQNKVEGVFANPVAARLIKASKSHSEIGRSQHR